MELTPEELTNIISKAILMTLDKVKFLSVRGGYEVKRKTGVSKDIVMNDPRYGHTRSASEEFTRTSKSEKTLRHAILPLLQFGKNNRTVNRTFSAVHKIIMADTINEKGKRNAHHGPTQLLRNFEFNSDCSMGTIFYAPFKHSINRNEGIIKIDIPPFVPIYNLVPPGGATHFKFVSCGSEIDFIKQKSNSMIQETEYIFLDEKETLPIQLLHKLPANSDQPLFLFFAIQFFQLVNGIYYRLRNKSKNPVTIIDVDKIGEENFIKIKGAI